MRIFSYVCQCVAFWFQNTMKPLFIWHRATIGSHRTLLRTWRSKHFARAGLNWAIKCSYYSEHRAKRLTATWQIVLRASLKESERGTWRQKRRDCWLLAVMLSLLCTAIVHQSLLEAKPVRTEQGFPRDPSLSDGMPRRKFSPRGSEGWMDRHHQGYTERQDKLMSNLSVIIVKVQGKVCGTEPSSTSTYVFFITQKYSYDILAGVCVQI